MAQEKIASALVCFLNSIKGSFTSGLMEAEVTPNEDFSGLPAEYHQQVMSPSSGTAQAIGPRQEEHAMPNGVTREVRAVAETEPDYDRALGATGIGATFFTGPGASSANVAVATAGSLPGSGDAERGAGGDGRLGIHQVDRGVDMNSPEVPGQRTSSEHGRRDERLFPHAAQGSATQSTDAMRGGLMWPSPLPSPTTRSVDGDEMGSLTSGNVIVQQGTAAMKWLTKLGEFVQRRVSQQTRGAEQTTVVQETVWSPGRHERNESQPLFDRAQSRRLQEMTRVAPHLYGTMAATRGGGGSESSQSFTKEQLEMEVKKQVDQAMEQQRSVAEENQRLRAELERLKSEAAMPAAVSNTPMMKYEAPPGRDPRVQEQARQITMMLEGNLAGLPGHGREQGGSSDTRGQSQDPRGNPGVLLEHDVGQGGDRALGWHGVSTGNAPGLPGPLTEPAKIDEGVPHPSLVPGGNPEGPQEHDVRWGSKASSKRGVLEGNLSGLPGRGRGQGGHSRARSQSPPRSNLLGFATRFGFWEGNAGTNQNEPKLTETAEGVSGAPVESVLGGNLPGLPGHGREQGGPFFDNMPGIYSGPLNEPGIYYSGPPPGLSGATGLDSSQGVGRSGNASQLDALVQGMTQLQAAMALQLGQSASRPETIRPGLAASELPKLSEADEMAAINVGDWLHGLSGPMGDLTDGSAHWWAQVLLSLEGFYRDYVNSSAMKKLQLRADDYAQPLLKEAKWLRVDKRAASMLLQSIPDNVRTEILANRLQSTLAILARIMTIYRPGSATERQQVLRALESPGVASSPSELVEMLRKWARWLKRAQDLGLQAPDPSILLRGIDQASKGQLDKHGEVAFRANMLRYSLELDSAPTLASVTKLQSHLLGEFEQIAYRGRAKAAAAMPPTVKAIGTGGGDGATTSQPRPPSSPTSPSSTRPCKFFLMDNGCQRAGCKFSHDWSNVPKEERAERCKACGAKGHMKRNCPLKAAVATDPPRREDVGRNPQAKVKNLKGGGNRKDDATSSSTAAASVPTAEPTASGTTTTSSSLGASQDSTTSGVNEAGTGARDVDDFLRNATQVLKMMAEQQLTSRSGPSMKMLKKAIMSYEERMALVDSGATHPLRKASVKEWGSADEVDVVVAGDGVQRMRQSTAGTLLMQPETVKAQTILPLGSLVGVLGYELVWNKRKCVLRGPDGKELVLRVSSGCPEVNEATALELIAKIEEEKVNQLNQSIKATKQAMMRAQEVQADPLWERSLNEYIRSGRFEDGFRALTSAPWSKDELRVELSKIITDLPEGEQAAWDLMYSLGFNRRMRKRLMSKDWVVKLCSGRRSSTDKLFKAVENNGTVVLDIDVQRLPQLDLFKAGPGVMQLLLWGAATGRIAGVLEGLPQHCAMEHTLRAVVLYEVATTGRAAMCAEADIPVDGVAFSLWASSESEEDESSLVRVFKWFRRWIAENHMELCHFDQGGLGHPRRRPTTMTTNMDVSELKGYRDERTATEEERGSWSLWAPVMARILARGLKRWKLRPGWYTRVVKALKAVDRRAWERHLANDHVPYRADCLQCIHSATGRPHRKCLHKDCYVLSADTLGPVRVPGVKGERFAVVFTYQFPKQKMIPEDQPIPEDELGGWNLDLAPGGKEEVEPVYEDMDEYVPDLEPDEDPSPEVLAELRRVQGEHVPIEQPEDVFNSTRVLAAKKKEVSDDWWEFRESSGVLIRHHITPRTTLFRPTSWNGCPISPAILDVTRVTEVKYVSGGVDTETSDWQGPQSGSRALERPWTGRTTFTISTAEIPEDEDQLRKDEESWEKIIGDLTKPVEMDTIYLVYPARARRGGDIMLAVQEAVLRLKLLGLPVARLHSDRGSEFASKGLRKWLLDHDIYHTRSEALVPQTNGAAERGVRWFKDDG